MTTTTKKGSKMSASTLNDRDNIEIQNEIKFRYGVNSDTYRLAALIKCVSNDMQRLLAMPLSHDIKESAMHEMIRVIVDNIG